MGSVFDLLEAIQKRPTLYVGWSEDRREDQMRDLEMLLHGYSAALHQHDVNEPGRNFLSKFSEYLRARYGWSMSCGPVVAIRNASTNADDAWELFWKLVWDYRDTLVANPRC